MSSLAIAFTLILANATVLLTESFWVVLAIWLTALLGAAHHGVLRLHLLFLGATVVPMFAALLIVWVPAAELPEIVDARYGGNVFWYVGFLALRIAAIGGVLQWLLLPLVNSGRFERFMKDLNFSKKLILSMSSTLVLLDDFKRKSTIVVEARIARGLVGNNLLSKWRSFLSTISPLIYTSIISGIQRSDLWTHRELNVIEYRIGRASSAEFTVRHLLVVTWFILLGVYSVFGKY